MEEIGVGELPPEIPESLYYWSIITMITLIVTIYYSYKKNGKKEVVENIFLWSLLYFGFWQIFWPSVELNEHYAAGVYFIAFGVCRAAKSIARKAI